MVCCLIINKRSGTFTINFLRIFNLKSVIHQMKKLKLISIFCPIILLVFSCGRFKKTNAIRNDQELIAHHSAYDEGILNNNTLPVLMPYNRIISPAGETVSYGDPEFENHSLDLAIVSGKDEIIVEDRYGISVSEQEAGQISTVGDAVDFVMAKAGS